MKTKKLLNKTILEYVIIALIIAVMVLMFVSFQSREYSYSMYNTSTIEYVRGVVREVVSEDLNADNGYYSTGRQILNVEILGGKAEGRTVEITNYVTPTTNMVYKEGSRVIVCADMPEGVEPYFSLYNFDRTVPIIVLVLFFFLVVVLVGRKKGFLSLVGLMFTVTAVICYLLPKLFEGGNAVIATLMTVIASTAVSCFCISGLNKKTVLNFISVVIGSISAGVIYRVFMIVLNLSGSSMAEAENLILISYSTGLELTGVLFSGVIISALGAVMDVAVSMGASLSEIKELNPKMTSKELFRSGMNIGRDMIGTMTNTLILAFAGGTLATLLIFISYGIQFHQLMSSNFMALEVATGLAGSIAVVLTVPISAAVCAFGFSKGKKA